MQRVNFFIFQHWVIGQCEKIIVKQIFAVHAWRALCPTLAARIRFQLASARLVWARKAPATSRSKLGVLAMQRVARDSAHARADPRFMGRNEECVLRLRRARVRH